MTPLSTTSDSLEPSLTEWDEKVLAALKPWMDTRSPFSALEWRTAWQVAERVREYDVRFVRTTLEALCSFGYAMANSHHDHHRKWIATPWLRAASTSERRAA